MTSNEQLGQPATCPIERRQWSAQMIRPETDAGVGGPSPFVETTLVLDADEPKATLYISALGLYRCFINGQRVSDDVLTPGWTSYQDRLSYQTYPVGQLLRRGENTITVWLGDGWLRSTLLWKGVRLTNTWGEHLGAIVEIRSGDRLLAATDANWKSGVTPILKSGIYFGEIYDARQEDQSATRGCVVDGGFDTARLVAHEIPGVKELASFAPISETQDAEGRTIYDFGQNVGGYIAFSVEGEAGAKMIVEHAEILDHEGKFNNANYRLAEARIEYTLKGDGVEHYRPMFTFQGFRFARVTICGRATIRAIESIPITSATRPTGSLTTESAGQQARREHRLVAARQLHRGADRLPAARRTHGLVGRCAGVRADRVLPAREPRLLGQMAARPDGRPAARRRDPALLARSDARARGHRRGLLRQHRLG